MAGRIRILSAHSGEDFERGRVGHRNGEAPVGAEPSLSDGVQPEEDIARGAPGTGLGTAACNRVRKPAQSMPARMGPVWLTVNVTGKERDTNPNVQCKDCGKAFSGGVTRIEDHILKHCKCSTPDLQKLKEEIIQKRADAATQKQQKKVKMEVQLRADERVQSSSGGAALDRGLPAEREGRRDGREDRGVRLRR